MMIKDVVEGLVPLHAPASPPDLIRGSGAEAVVRASFSL
jgi:hypothetical protein